MNRRERRHGRMFSLPLLLALTGLALLPLEWVLRLEGFDAFGELRQTLLHAAPCVIFPLILLGLYTFRVPSKVGYVFSFLSLGLSLAQLGIVLYCTKHTPAGLLAWVPGHSLLTHTDALREQSSAQNILLSCSDASFVLSTFSAVFSCLIYGYVKARSDQRNAEFDRRYAYLRTPAQPAAAPPTPEPAAVPPTPKPAAAVPTDEPTRIVQLPPEYKDT